MKKNKDILFLLQFFYPEYISSATLPFDTATKLAEEGFSVDVLCGYPHEYTDEENIPYKETVNNINIKRAKYLQMDRKKAFGRIVNYLSLTIVMLFHLFSLRKYKAIVVYSNPPILPFVAALASKLFKCKLIFVAYDLYPEIAIKTDSLSENSIVTKLMNYINKFVYKLAYAVVVLSSEMKEYVIKNRNISADKVYVIPNWFKDEYQPDDKKDDNPFVSVANKRFVIGYFGNMGVAQDMKPIKDAIRYFKDDKDVCFFLAGHGSKYFDLKKMIADEKIENTYFYGFLKGQDYLDALHACDCAVITLKKGLTGLCVPSKTYGYMMQGVPIIVFMDDSDIVKDVQLGAGYHITDNSSQEFIQLIDWLKNNPEDYKDKGNRCRSIYCENYTPDVCLEKYVKLLSDLKLN